MSKKPRKFEMKRRSDAFAAARFGKSTLAVSTTAQTIHRVELMRKMFKQTQGRLF